MIAYMSNELQHVYSVYSVISFFYVFQYCDSSRTLSYNCKKGARLVFSIKQSVDNNINSKSRGISYEPIWGLGAEGPVGYSDIFGLACAFATSENPPFLSCLQAEKHYLS